MLQQVLYNNMEDSCPTPLCFEKLSLTLPSDLAVYGQVSGLHSSSAVNKPPYPAEPHNIQRSCSMMPWFLHPCFLPNSDTSGPVVARRGRRCQMGTEICVWLAELSKLKRLPWYVTAISHQQMPDQRRQIPSDAKCCRGLMIYGHISLYFKVFMLGYYFMFPWLIAPMQRLARVRYLHYDNYWYLPLLGLYLPEDIHSSPWLTFL